MKRHPTPLLTLLKLTEKSLKNENMKEIENGSAPKKFIKSTKKGTVFENHRKSLIHHYERSELHLQFDWTKVHKKCQKSGEFLKTLSLQANSVTSQVTFSKTKIAGKSRNSTEILKHVDLLEKF